MPACLWLFRPLHHFVQTSNNYYSQLQSAAYTRTQQLSIKVINDYTIARLVRAIRYPCNLHDRLNRCDFTLYPSLYYGNGYGTLTLKSQCLNNVLHMPTHTAGTHIKYTVIHVLSHMHFYRCTVVCDACRRAMTRSAEDPSPYSDAYDPSQLRPRSG